MDCECGNKAIYHRKYEKRFYCKKCFIRSIEKKFMKTAHENKLIKFGDKIAVGISGGKDSAVLLYLLNELRKNVPFEIIAISVDEGIEKYRNDSIEYAKRLTDKLGIDHHISSFKEEFSFTDDDLPKETKHCSYCGTFRRYLLNKKAKILGANKLAIGHNLDDEAQSIMMNFVRNDYSRFQRLGTNSSDKKLITRIKPLRDIPEKEITLYAILKEIPFFPGECPYSFDNLRREMQTMINDLEKNHPGTKFQIVSFYDKLKPMLDKTGEGVNYCKICDEPTAMEICKSCELLEKLKKDGGIKEVVR